MAARIFTLCLILLAAPLAALATPPAEPVDDAELRAHVRDRLTNDGVLPMDLIRVTVDEGLVTLDGQVPTLLAADRATELVINVHGVKDVANKLIVATEPVSDAVLRRDVILALTSDPATDAYEIDVAADRGAITLSGEVQSWAERLLAATVTRTVRGVSSVDNQLTVEQRAIRPDGEVEADVRQRLRWHAAVNERWVTVEVEAGVVTLEGTVASMGERQLAGRLCWVTGVSKVDNELIVVPGKLRREIATMTDAEMKDVVTELMRLDPRLSPFHLLVTVKEGKISLRGKVDHLEARERAAALCGELTGVRGVDLRDVEVAPEIKRTREQIADAVRTALSRHAGIDATGIRVSVQADGVVSLHGKVGSHFERRRAAATARRTLGVLRVRNLIEVGPRPVARIWTSPWRLPLLGKELESIRADHALRRQIEASLRWSAWVRAADIEVEVQDGVATLRGKVSTWHEYRQARRAAYRAGAEHVINRVEVRFY